MDKLEKLLHIQDKELSVFKSKATTILTDHTNEIHTLRKEMKDLTALIFSKFEGMWLKIIGLVSTLIGIALFISLFVK